MKKGPRLTLEEHRALGAELKAMRDRLVALHVQLGNGYTFKLGGQVDKATRAIDQLRSDLDDIVFQDFSFRDDLRLDRIYYPGYPEASALEPGARRTLDGG